MKISENKLRKLIREQIDDMVTVREVVMGGPLERSIKRWNSAVGLSSSADYDDIPLIFQDLSVDEAIQLVDELKEFMDQVSDLWDEMKPEQEREERGSRLGIRRREP
jgi:hypothetical protein